MEQKKKSRIPVAVIHAVIWLLVFALPFFYWPRAGATMDWRMYAAFFLLPAAFACVFYLNYFLLADRLLFRGKTLYYIMANLAIISAVVLLLHWWHDSDFVRSLGGLRPIKPLEVPDTIFKMETVLWLRDGTLLVLIAGLALAIRTTLQWFQTDREKQALEAARAEAELKNLKNQLNPHFLFNTLNNIYSLIEFNPDKARYAVESLSRMLRHILYDNDQETVPIEHEFAFMRSYIELMALRLTPSSTLEVDIPGKGNGVMIAPLLFINSVENAFKHGISAKRTSFIRISIRVDESRNVECTVENSYFPRISERSGSGIGLENLRRRLALLYPDSHELVSEQRGDTYFSQIVIHLHKPS